MTRHRIDLSTTLTMASFQDEEPRLIEAPVTAAWPADVVRETATVALDPYLPSTDLIKVLNLAIALGRPLLLQGDPGCGKTRLAHAVAWALRLPLEIAVIKSTSRAQDLLYVYDAVNRLYDAQLGTKVKTTDGAEHLRSERVESYIRPGPLGGAIARAAEGRRSVVLLDEIDKADLDFPNDLLWELDRLEFRVAEAPKMAFSVGDRPEMRPIVIVTNNDEKALPAAFLRRCVYYFIEFDPSESRLHKILAAHAIGNANNQALITRAIDVVLRLRELDLAKKPGLSELLDWAGYLQAVQASPEDLDALPYLGVLLKQDADQQSAREAFKQALAKKNEPPAA